MWNFWKLSAFDKGPASETARGSIIGIRDHVGRLGERVCRSDNGAKQRSDGEAKNKIQHGRSMPPVSISQYSDIICEIWAGTGTSERRSLKYCDIVNHAPVRRGDVIPAITVQLDMLAGTGARTEQALDAVAERL